MSYGNTQYGSSGQAGQADSPLTSFDSINKAEGIADTLGGGSLAGEGEAPSRQAGMSGGAFAPKDSSPLASQSPMTDLSSNSASLGAQSETNPFLKSSNSGPAADTNPFTSSSSSHAGVNANSGFGSAAAMGSIHDNGSVSSSGLNAGDPVNPGPYAPSAPQSSDTGSTGTSGIDIGGAQTSGTGISTPGGVVKSGDHVENLVSALGGIALTAPVAAYEIISGKAKHHAANVQEMANQQGLGGVGNQLQGHLSNAASLAQEKVNQLNASRGADAPPISSTISAYATSAAQQAQALAASAAHQAQDLIGRAQANAPSTGEVQARASDATSQASANATQTGHGIASTLQGYAASAAHSAQSLGASIGLTSPPPSATTASHGTSSTASHGTSSTAVAPSASSDTVSGRYDLNSSEIPTRDTVTKINTPESVGNVDVPSTTQSSDSSATSGFGESIPYGAQSAQTGGASYGEGRLGSGTGPAGTTSF